MNNKFAKLYKETARKVAEVKGNIREIAILVDAREYAIRTGETLENAEAIVRKNVEQIENNAHPYIGKIEFELAK